MAENVAIDDLPDVIFEPYTFLLDETGVEPVVEKNGYGKRTLTHLGERTKMTIHFRLDGRKWRWERSFLWIDGERAPLAAGWDMYVSIYKDPDNGRVNHVPKGAKKAKLPESQAVDEQYVPAAVARELKNLRKNAKDSTDVTPTIDSHANEYLITVHDRDDNSRFLFFFTYDGTRWSATRFMLVNPAGYDLTYLIGEDPAQFEAFLRKLLGNPTGRIDMPAGPVGASQQAGVSNSVAVRKATVFRV